MFSRVEHSVPKTFKFKMVFSLILGFVFLKYTVDASKNSITLQNGNYITCIYPEIASTIYLNPPVEQSENKSPFFLHEKWDSDDWNAADAKKPLQAPVTDRRWEAIAQPCSLTVDSNPILKWYQELTLVESKLNNEITEQQSTDEWKACYNKYAKSESRFYIKRIHKDFHELKNVTESPIILIWLISSGTTIMKKLGFRLVILQLMLLSHLVSTQVEAANYNKINDENIIRKTEDQSIIITGDGWSEKKSEVFFPGPVTEDRWKDFPVELINYFILKPPVSSISFSVFEPNQMEFFVSDADTMDNFHFMQENKGKGWIHFTIMLEYNDVHILQNNHNVYSVSNMVVDQIVVKSTEQYSWKIHKYNCYSSTTVSKEAINFKIPQNIKELVIYTFLCEHCSLEIYKLSHGNEISNVTTISNNLKSSGIKTIQLESNESGIVVKRTSLNDEASGHWCVDIKLHTVKGPKNEELQSSGAPSTLGLQLPFGNEQGIKKLVVYSGTLFYVFLQLFFMRH